MQLWQRVLLVLIVFAVVAFGVAYFAATRPTATRQLTAPASLDDRLVEAGRYVAIAGDCAACHTAPGGKQFAGGLAVASPIGNIYSTNITPDRDTGIGTLTLDEFDRAVRYGIGKRGGTVYPAMPWPSYAGMSDQDLVALYAYFMRGVEPVHAPNHATEIRWPLSLRWPLALWRRAFGPPPDQPPFDQKTYADAAVARGAYLVQTLGHCGSCHTPRAITLQERGLDERSATYLTGGQVIDGWFAVNLRGNTGDGLGTWSVDDIIASLRTGRAPGRAVIGSPMQDVVLHSTQYMNDADLHAIALYLKTLAPAAGTHASFRPDSRTAQDLAAGKENGRGAQLFVDNCAACHRTSGKGEGTSFPAMAGNSTVLASDPQSVIRLILDGYAMPSTKTAPSNLGMPGFGWRMSDDEVAQLVTFLRSNWGNDAPSVSAASVTKVRREIEQAKSRAQAGMPGADAKAH